MTQSVKGDAAVVADEVVEVLKGNLEVPILLGEPDAVPHSVGLAAECRGLEAWFVELGVAPAVLEPTADPVDALDAASAALAGGEAFVPLGLWAGLQALRAKANR